MGTLTIRFVDTSFSPQHNGGTGLNIRLSHRKHSHHHTLARFLAAPGHVESLLYPLLPGVTNGSCQRLLCGVCQGWWGPDPCMKPGLPHNLRNNIRAKVKAMKILFLRLSSNVTLRSFNPSVSQQCSEWSNCLL